MRTPERSGGNHDGGVLLHRARGGGHGAFDRKLLEGWEMKKCDKDNTPCLHAPCLEVEGCKCCKECQYVGKCASSCFKVKEEIHDNT